MDTRYKWRLTDLDAQPKTLLDIVNLGIKNPNYSTCAFAEVLHQIYESNQLVL